MTLGIWRHGGVVVRWLSCGGGGTGGELGSGLVVGGSDRLCGGGGAAFSLVWLCETGGCFFLEVM